MMDSYIHLSIIFPKAYECTVQLENRKTKNAFNTWISISEFFYFWEFEQLVTVIATKELCFKIYNL